MKTPSRENKEVRQSVWIRFGKLTPVRRVYKEDGQTKTQTIMIGSGYQTAAWKHVIDGITYYKFPQYDFRLEKLVPLYVPETDIEILCEYKNDKMGG